MRFFCECNVTYNKLLKSIISFVITLLYIVSSKDFICSNLNRAKSRTRTYNPLVTKEMHYHCAISAKCIKCFIFYIYYPLLSKYRVKYVYLSFGYKGRLLLLNYWVKTLFLYFLNVNLHLP